MSGGDEPTNGRRPWILGIDTSTTQVVVAAAAPDGSFLGATSWEAGYRHGEQLLPSIGRLHGELNLRRSRIAAIVVGTGPGAFTGLRVGIATAKGLAHALGRPIVGISSGEALIEAAKAATGASSIALLLPAGPSDRIVVRAGEPPVMLPGGEEPDVAADELLVAVDLSGRAPEDAAAFGDAARFGLGPALMRLGVARLAAGDEDDLARLVPDYVTLPRGVSAPSGEVAWSHDLRVKLTIEAMRLDDLDAVHLIELASFSAPWPPNAYRSELETNRLATYLVGRLGGEIVAYGGMWLMVDEAHITTFAVHPRWRRQRIGERLLVAFLDLAVDRGAREATLEVRLSNIAARRLYEKYGFRPVGLRPRYYSDDGEDALIMTTEPLGDARFRDRLARLRVELDASPAPGLPDGADGGPVGAAGVPDA